VRTATSFCFATGTAGSFRFGTGRTAALSAGFAQFLAFFFANYTLAAVFTHGFAGLFAHHFFAGCLVQYYTITSHFATARSVSFWCAMGSTTTVAGAIGYNYLFFNMAFAGFAAAVAFAAMCKRTGGGKAYCRQRKHYYQPGKGFENAPHKVALYFNKQVHAGCQGQY
jgi:hypothetical protein